MQRSDRATLWSLLNAAGRASDRFIHAQHGSVRLGDLDRGSALNGGPESLRGRSILISTAEQLTAALTMIELDGVAARMVLCPPGLPLAHLNAVMSAASTDVAVTDGPIPNGAPSVVLCSPRLFPPIPDRRWSHQTEWVLLTSGTTGPPKLVQHTLSTLVAPIGDIRTSATWSTFYDVRRYGGLQILLRALLGGGSLVLSSAREPVGEFLARAGRAGVTHISGTPSHWRRALMSPSAHELSPSYVRLSGEIADQAIIDAVRACYPGADIAHAFASTEAGVAFAVTDGFSGFPCELIGRPSVDVETKIEDGSLRIRSSRNALRYLDSRQNAQGKALKDPDGFVDTSDMVERRGNRYIFIGRRDGVINVGGLKVHPEEVEAVINLHPAVRMSVVRARKSPITGAVVTADVVLKSVSSDDNALKQDIIAACHRALAGYKVPAVVRIVAALEVAATGKLARS